MLFSTSHPYGNTSMYNYLVTSCDLLLKIVVTFLSIGLPGLICVSLETILMTSSEDNCFAVLGEEKMLHVQKYTFHVSGLAKGNCVIVMTLSVIFFPLQLTILKKRESKRDGKPPNPSQTLAVNMVPPRRFSTEM